VRPELVPGLLVGRGHVPGDWTAIAALDDPHPDVRAAALDALDLQNPPSPQAIVVRLHDASLHRGRRAAALASFGSRCEQFLLELSDVDPAHLLNYARALAICGSERSRPSLCRWTTDPRADVRAAAFAALAHVGLDDPSARCALEALESGDAQERAMAARAS
jgi:HEAT repeat protein